MKPSPAEWRSHAARLAEVYSADPELAAQHFRSHRHFMEVPGGAWPMVSVHRVIHIHGGGDPGEGPRSGQSLRAHLSSLAAAGYRQIGPGISEFEPLWGRYQAICESLSIAPSGGTANPPHQRHFYVLGGAAGAEALGAGELAAGGSIMEGAPIQVTTNRYERDRDLRAQHIELARQRNGGRLACEVCGIDFHERYGPLGEGYIHIHHRDPLGDRQEAHLVDAGRDLAAVCPNCHAMLHRRRPALTIERLRELLNP